MIYNKHIFLFLLFTSLFWGGVVACQADLQNPPRLATATALALQAGQPVTDAPLLLPAPTGTPVPDQTPQTITTPRSEANPQLTVWINETSVTHKAALEAMAAEFTQEEGIAVTFRLVSDALLPELVNTAALSGTLPDLVLHPVAFTTGWAERGILDSALTEEALNQLGADTFDPAALAWVTNGAPATAGPVLGLPSDGYQQLIIYRQDWFAENNLAPPLTYQAMISAAATLYDNDALISGFVIPTESNLVTTFQAFEHLALGNGCQLIDSTGEVRLLDDACQQALNFYYNIVHRFSPIGVQTGTSTERAYLAGRTGLIMAPPTILPLLAGLNPDNPPLCAECNSQPDFLAQNSTILTQVSGSGAEATPANYSEMMVLGLTTAADRETAVIFANYWFNQGYPQWLSIEPERKVPLRLGTPAQPGQFIDIWGQQPLLDNGPALVDIYGPEVVTLLRDNIATTPRWGIMQGQGALITTLYEEATFPIVLQEMLSGYFNSSQSIFEAYNRVIDLIPNYQFTNTSEQPDPSEE